MQIFQNSGVYQTYLQRLDRLAAGATSFEQRQRIFLDDRFGALHFLKPVLDGSRDAFFTNGDDDVLQRFWARENGLPESSTLETILLAQIEHHRTEVWYNLDPIRYGSDFVQKLPGCVTKKLCWRAAPSGNADLSAYDAVLGNFSSILNDWQRKGCRVALFYPALDPVMDEYVTTERPIDVLFVGGYSRHHSRRTKVLESVAALASRRNIAFCLDTSRLTKLAESPIGILPPLRSHRRPAAIRDIAQPPVFGRDLYAAIGRSKIVLNGAIDMAGADRGNMRCFEAMGCGALLVSDAGNYPLPMEPGVTIATYDSPEQAVALIEDSLSNHEAASTMAALGRKRMAETYNKPLQWQSFIDLVGDL
jgi:hypothetical protein